MALDDLTAVPPSEDEPALALDPSTDEPDEAIDAQGSPTGQPVAVAEPPPVAQRQCEDCKQWFPKLEVNGSPPRCAACATASDAAITVDIKGPNAMRNLAIAVSALQAAVFGGNDGPKQA